MQTPPHKLSFFDEVPTWNSTILHNAIQYWQCYLNSCSSDPNDAGSAMFSPAAFVASCFGSNSRQRDSTSGLHNCQICQMEFSGIQWNSVEFSGQPMAQLSTSPPSPMGPWIPWASLATSAAAPHRAKASKVEFRPQNRPWQKKTEAKCVK